MNLVKIMPCLDMKESRVIKGVRFVDLRDANDPVANADRSIKTYPREFM